MPYITKDNARELQAKAIKARLLTSDLLAHRIEQANAATEYVDKRRARVRLQLERIDDMMMKETDPQRLDRLASAQNRLSEQERILDGRPLPGSNRPAAARRPRGDDLPAAPPADPTQPAVSPVTPQDPSSPPPSIVEIG